MGFSLLQGSGNGNSTISASTSNVSVVETLVTSPTNTGYIFFYTYRATFCKEPSPGAYSNLVSNLVVTGNFRREYYNRDTDDIPVMVLRFILEPNQTAYMHVGFRSDTDDIDYSYAWNYIGLAIT